MVGCLKRDIKKGCSSEKKPRFNEIREIREGTAWLVMYTLCYRLTN
jgi:hypothetical protein